MRLNTLVPDFTLPDFNGNDLTLSGFRDKKKVLMVFNRGLL